MKTTIYLTSLFMTFLILLVGMDGILGNTCKWFSLVVFVIWLVSVLTGNWNEIKTFLRDGMGYKF